MENQFCFILQYNGNRFYFVTEQDAINFAKGLMVESLNYDKTEYGRYCHRFNKSEINRLKEAWNGNSYRKLFDVWQELYHVEFDLFGISLRQEPKTPILPF